MIRSNVDVVAIMIVLVIVAVVSTARNAAAYFPVAARAIGMYKGAGCPIVRAVSLIPTFQVYR